MINEATLLMIMAFHSYNIPNGQSRSHALQENFLKLHTCLDFEPVVSTYGRAAWAEKECLKSRLNFITASLGSFSWAR